MQTRLILALIATQDITFLGWIPKIALALLGIDIPPSVVLGAGIRLPHRAHGVVIHPLTRIGANVTIYHNVTIGRADAHLQFSESSFEGFVLEDGVLIGAGAIVLGGKGVTTIGAGAIIGAGTVLAHSIGRGEIWAGNPAKLVGRRDADDA